jgi:subtilase family serine protease
MTYKVILPAAFIVTSIGFGQLASARGYTSIDDFKAKPPIHVLGKGNKTPAGLSPDVIKKIYNLPANGGKGTIAIIGAYDDKDIEKDLAVFDQEYKLKSCTTANGCFEKHLIDSNTKHDSGWALETSLDVEWAHAIAPDAKILLVAAKTSGGTNLLKAVDYARAISDVVAISMSWGGPEFASETGLDSHFVSNSGVTFFASSGDNGAGVSWPAVSPNVVGVGGTTLIFTKDGKLNSEKAWNGSGGGVSQFEFQPRFQNDYSIGKAGNKRAVPDVSFNADPASGYSVYKAGKWYVVGGTSAGAPQWAGIKALGLSADNSKFYADKSSTNNKQFFRDITSGTNGNCTYYCDARKRYDYVTGLGSPLTVKF